MNQSFVAICIVFMLICFQPVKPERWDGNTLYDLEGQGATFTTQANLWTISTLRVAGTRVSTCDGNSLLGGYNILAQGIGKYFERTFTGLPDHNQITFYMELWALDSWDLGDDDHFTIRFDTTTTITGWTIPVYGGGNLGLSDICGANYNDAGLIKTFITLPHNVTSVTLRLTSYLTEGPDNESFGFRNIYFIFDIVDTPANTFCGSTQFSLPNNWCSCPSGKYMSPARSGNCLDCHTSCLTCTGALNTQCSSCKDGTYLNGGRCLACDGSCATCTGGNTNQCKTCKAGDYLVGNNTCVSVCPEPFYNTTDGTILFCETPCPGRFAYRNGICLANCVLPYQSYILATLRACYCYEANVPATDKCYPCDSSCNTCDGTADNQCRTCYPGSYLDRTPTLSIGTCEACISPCVTCTGPSNGQCSSCIDGYYLNGGTCIPCGPSCLTCTGPNNGQCKTCHTGDYLVGNNTCVPICPQPFFSTSSPSITFCETPCPSNFAYKNGVCRGTCPSPPFQTYTLAILKACVCYTAFATASDPCYSCEASCATCNGTSASECFSCYDGFYLKNTTGKTIGTCESCDPTCATCYGENDNQCNTCFSDAYLITNGSANNGSCADCHSTCKTCNGPTKTNCLSCPDRFYLDLNDPLSVDGACKPCHPTCATCTGPAIDECVTCIEPGECPKIFFNVSNSEASSGMIILGFIIGGTTSLMIVSYLINRYKFARAKSRMEKKPRVKIQRIIPLPLPHSPATSPLKKSRFGDERKSTVIDQSDIVI